MNFYHALKIDGCMQGFRQMAAGGKNEKWWFREKNKKGKGKREKIALKMHNIYHWIMKNEIKILTKLYQLTYLLIREAKVYAIEHNRKYKTKLAIYPVAG